MLTPHTVKRAFECRGALPLLNSDIQLMLTDRRVPEVSAFIQVIDSLSIYHPCCVLHAKFIFSCLLLSLQFTSEEKTITLFSYKEEEVYEWVHIIEHTIKLATGETSVV